MPSTPPSESTSRVSNPDVTATNNDDRIAQLEARIKEMEEEHAKVTYRLLNNMQIIQTNIQIVTGVSRDVTSKIDEVIKSTGSEDRRLQQQINIMANVVNRMMEATTKLFTVDVPAPSTDEGQASTNGAGTSGGHQHHSD